MQQQQNVRVVEAVSKWKWYAKLFFAASILINLFFFFVPGEKAPLLLPLFSLLGLCVVAYAIHLFLKKLFFTAHKQRIGERFIVPKLNEVYDGISLTFHDNTAIDSLTDTEWIYEFFVKHSDPSKGGYYLCGWDMVASTTTRFFKHMRLSELKREYNRDEIMKTYLRDRVAHDQAQAELERKGLLAKEDLL